MMFIGLEHPGSPPGSPNKHCNMCMHALYICGSTINILLDCKTGVNSSTVYHFALDIESPHRWAHSLKTRSNHTNVLWKKQGPGTANDLEGTHEKVQECCLASWVRIFSPSYQPVLSQKLVAWQGHCLNIYIGSHIVWISSRYENGIYLSKVSLAMQNNASPLALSMWNMQWSYKKKKSRIGLSKQFHENLMSDGASVAGDDTELKKHHDPSGHQCIENRHLFKSGVSVCLSYGRWAVVVVKVKPMEPPASPWPLRFEFVQGRLRFV